MITEIPSADDFYDAGLNQIYLAWQIVMLSISDFQNLGWAEVELGDNEKKIASEQYWKKSQPVLANAFGLIQQATEMALKGRIAAISPYLLIARDPKDWPSGVDKKAVPFSDFRSLDAADLLRVHNTFSSEPLDEQFKTFWDELRRNRNKIMHSVSSYDFEVCIIVKAILTVIKNFFNDIKWPKRLLKLEAEGKYAAYGIGDEDNQNVIMTQIDLALDCLTTSECKKFFGLDEKRRTYTCPSCYYKANRDWQEEWPTHAQFPPNKRGATQLYCFVCDQTSEVERLKCTNSECRADVIHEGKCLACLQSQDDPTCYISEYVRNELGIEHQYLLTFRQQGGSRSHHLHFSSDEDAIEHCRKALMEPHLHSCGSVTITSYTPFRSNNVIGTWRRQGAELEWLKSQELPLTSFRAQALCVHGNHVTDCRLL